jgi:hypothetical protein
VGEGVAIGVGDGACAAGADEHETSNAADISSNAMRLAVTVGHDRHSRRITNRS